MGIDDRALKYLNSLIIYVVTKMLPFPVITHSLWDFLLYTGDA